jgi:hypothetical protein
MSQFNDEGNIFLALQALQNDPKLRIRRAASIYNACPKKLGRRQKGIQSRPDKGREPLNVFQYIEWIDDQRQFNSISIEIWLCNTSIHFDVPLIECVILRYVMYIFRPGGIGPEKSPRGAQDVLS